MSFEVADRKISFCCCFQSCKCSAAKFKKRAEKQNLVHLRLSFRSKRLIFKNDYSWSFIDFMLVCFILEDFAIIRFCVRTISSGFDLISQMKIWLVVHQWWRHHLQKILALLKKRTAFWSVLSLVSVSSNGGEESGSEQLRSQTTELWKKIACNEEMLWTLFLGIAKLLKNRKTMAQT